MFILFFVCWVVFNQSLTIEIAIFGLLISAAMYLFACRFMDFSIKKDLFIMKKLPGIIAYVFVVIWEVIKANAVLFGKFYIKRSLRNPVIVTFETKLKTRTARMLLANAITLTPGTITAGMEGTTFTIHCVDKSLAAGLDNTVFEKHLLKLEEGFDK